MNRGAVHRKEMVAKVLRATTNGTLREEGGWRHRLSSIQCSALRRQTSLIYTRNGQTRRRHDIMVGAMTQGVWAWRRSTAGSPPPPLGIERGRGAPGAGRSSRGQRKQPDPDHSVQHCVMRIGQARSQIIWRVKWCSSVLPSLIFEKRIWGWDFI